jgi:hypothetical protein
MQETTNLPAKLADEAANLLRASESQVRLLKFRKGKFFAKKKEEIPLGHQFRAFCRDWSRGWTKFVDNKIVDRRIGRVADGFRVPDRDELGDLDQSKWALGFGGVSVDPWVFQNLLPLEDPETGELFVFVTSSFGGKMAIHKLCHEFARNITRGTPTIELACETFPTDDYGPTLRPDFPIVKWEHDTGTVEVTLPMSAEMDDEIPF